MVRLIPMSDSDYEAFISWAEEDYAREQVRVGAWSAEEAAELAHQAFAARLPDGLATPKQILSLIVSAAAGEHVGWLWWGVEERGARRFATLNDIQIFPAQRRRGYAALALQALEQQVRAEGLESIFLHVFGHNEGARALYRKLGYVERNITMMKALAD